MAQATWESALTGSNSNANQQGLQSLNPAVSRIIVQDSKKGMGSSDPHKSAEESDSESDDDDSAESSLSRAHKAHPAKYRYRSSVQCPRTRMHPSHVLPPTHRSYAEAPTVLNPIRVQLSPPSRLNLTPQTPTGGSMQTLDAAEALKTSGKVCCQLCSGIMDRGWPTMLSIVTAPCWTMFACGMQSLYFRTCASSQVRYPSATMLHRFLLLRCRLDNVNNWQTVSLQSWDCPMGAAMRDDGTDANAFVLDCRQMYLLH